jgi:hypothetical protein
LKKKVFDYIFSHKSVPWQIEKLEAQLSGGLATLSLLCGEIKLNFLSLKVFRE